MSEIQQWKDATKARQQRAREAIADCALQNRMEDVVAITYALSPLNLALEKLIAARKEWQQAVDPLDQAAGINHTKAPASRVRLTIHWEKTGRQVPSQVIDEPKAADGLAQYVSALVRVLGPHILPHTRRLQCSGSSIVSRNPRLDFLNPSTGDLYGHRPIANSGWHVKTHSSTQDKADQVHQIKAFLGLPGQSVIVDIIKK